MTSTILEGSATPIECIIWVVGCLLTAWLWLDWCLVESLQNNSAFHRLLSACGKRSVLVKVYIGSAKLGKRYVRSGL